MIRFAHPELLWLLLGLIPLLFLGRRGGVPAVRIGAGHLLDEVGRASRVRLGWLRPLLRLGALALLIVALARPQVGHTTSSVQASGIDLVLGIDVSTSMEARDMAHRTRIEVVREVVATFVEGRPNDRIGIVAFAGAPYLVSPLTLDHDWLLQNLARLRTGLVDIDGTAIGSALAASVNRLREEDSKSKVVVLLTDGANNAGSVQPTLAAQLAASQGVKVYTIGVGSAAQAPIPVRQPDGRTELMLADVQVDEATLREIAEATGGRFYRAGDPRSLQHIYDEIDQLEKTTRTLSSYERWTERFQWPALGGLLLLAAELALSLLLRRVP